MYPPPAYPTTPPTPTAPAAAAGFPSPYTSAPLANGGHVPAAPPQPLPAAFPPTPFPALAQAAPPTRVLATQITMPFKTFAVAWTQAVDRPGLLAAGSFVYSTNNKLCIIEHDPSDPSFISAVAEAPVTYPISKVAWAPLRSGQPYLLATTSDVLRLWRLGRSLTMEAVLGKPDPAVAPLTSLDWNPDHPQCLVTSCVDTTCTVWDLTAQKAATQLVAHDKEVLDVAFAHASPRVFASAGADGSVRMFDLRALDHSNLVFEHTAPLLRLAWHPTDAHYLAMTAYASHGTTLVDLRRPARPLAELRGHAACVNAMAWRPPHHFLSAGEDGQLLLFPPAPAPLPQFLARLGRPIENLAVGGRCGAWAAMPCAEAIQVMPLVAPVAGAVGVEGAG